MKRSLNPQRLKLGTIYDRLITELLQSTNTGNLSHDWNPTDMTRYAIAELWKRTGKPLPEEAKKLLPHFWKDFDFEDVHSV